MGRGIARSHHVHFHLQPMQKSLDRKSSRNVREFAIPLRKGAIHTYLFGNLQAVQNDLSEKRVPNSWPIFVSIQLSVSRLAGKFPEKSLKKTLKEALLMQKTSMSTSVASVLELVFINTTQGTFL